GLERDVALEEERLDVGAVLQGLEREAFGLRPVRGQRQWCPWPDVEDDISGLDVTNRQASGASTHRDAGPEMVLDISEQHRKRAGHRQVSRVAAVVGRHVDGEACE